ncbi:MAG: hypothetical protein JSV55_10520, partial [Deltaproteobacteria bacterium]
ACLLPEITRIGRGHLFQARYLSVHTVRTPQHQERQGQDDPAREVRGLWGGDIAQDSRNELKL